MAKTVSNTLLPTLAGQHDKLFCATKKSNSVVKPDWKSIIYLQRYHFSEISENLEMSGNSAKVSEKSRNRPKVRERSAYLCSRGNLIVAAQQNAVNQTVVW